MRVAAEPSRALSASGSRPVRVGTFARIEMPGGDVCAGRVSFVDRELVGLKTTSIVDGRLTVGDTVTLVIGQSESMVAAQARVLAATGSFVRLSRRESSEELGRRRPLRVPIEQSVQVTCAERVSTALVTDMSASRCAIRGDEMLPVGGTVMLSMQIAGTDLTLSGRVVRAWRTAEEPGAYAGIQFDPLPPATTQLIGRYLVEQLRRTSSPRPGLNSGRSGPIEVL